MSPLEEGLVQQLRRFAAEAAREEVAKANEQREWIDQDSSPLSREVHLRLCRSGELASHKIGKRVLVHRDEMNRFIRSFPSAVTSRGESTEDAIDRELRALDLHPKTARTSATRKESKTAA